MKTHVPLDSRFLLDLPFLVPPVAGAIASVVLKTMREGYMYALNRRYYKLRPPK